MDPSVNAPPGSVPAPPSLAALGLRMLTLYALAEAQAGHARTLHLAVDGPTFSVADDGRGHAIDRRVADSPYLRFIYTHLDHPDGPAFADEAAAVPAPVQLQGLGLSLLNAQCEALTVTVRKPQGGLQLAYAGGRLVSEAQLPPEARPAGAHGNRIEARVAAAQAARPDEVAGLKRWANRLAALHPELAWQFNGMPL